MTEAHRIEERCVRQCPACDGFIEISRWTISEQYIGGIRWDGKELFEHRCGAVWTADDECEWGPF